MLLLHNLHWTGTANISCMPINVCHISLGYTGFRIPQSDHSVDPAAIATGASWSGSYCNIPKCQLFSQFLTITNKHVRVNTDVLIQIPPCHHTPILGQKTERKETCSGLRGTRTAFPSDWPISWGEGIKTCGLSWRILNSDPLFKLVYLLINFPMIQTSILKSWIGNQQYWRSCSRLQQMLTGLRLLPKSWSNSKRIDSIYLSILRLFHVCSELESYNPEACGTTHRNPIQALKPDGKKCI